MITPTQVLAELEAMGSEQTRKTYKRHGVGDNQYGVSYGNLKNMIKKIKVNHEIAQHLWATGNHDARILATMIADPKQANDALLEDWVSDLGNYVSTDALSAFVAKTPLALPKMEQWTKSEDEWISTTGWNLLTSIAMNDHSLPDAYFEPYLAQIDRDLHTSKNRVRYSMNNALIAIGMRNPDLEKKAVSIAQKIGVVIVDHGDTNCKTPDAVSYIQKAKDRKKV